MIGEKIKEARKLKGISQEDLAYAVKKHTNTIARWERGEMNPSGETLQKVAQALNIPISALYDDEQQAMPKQNLSMAYWGQVADNIKGLSKNSDKGIVAIIKSMLLSSLKAIDTIDNPINPNGTFIKQENIGRDAIIANIN